MAKKKSRIPGPKNISMMIASWAGGRSTRRPISWVSLTLQATAVATKQRKTGTPSGKKNHGPKNRLHTGPRLWDFPTISQNVRDSCDDKAQYLHTQTLNVWYTWIFYKCQKFYTKGRSRYLLHFVKAPFGDFDVVVVVEAKKLVPDHDFVGAFWFFTVGSKFCEEKCNKGWEI